MWLWGVVRDKQQYPLMTEPLQLNNCGFIRETPKDTHIPSLYQYVMPPATLQDSVNKMFITKTP